MSIGGMCDGDWSVDSRLAKALQSMGLRMFSDGEVRRSGAMDDKNCTSDEDMIASVVRQPRTIVRNC